MTDIPNSLLRFFDKEEYALSFIKGQARFGLLDKHRHIEDSRRDSEEGRVSFSWTGRDGPNVQYSGSSLNHFYILCTSHPEACVPTLASTFGLFVVRIREPLVLLERMKLAWQSSPLALRGNAFIAPVVYNKGGLLDPDPYFIAPVNYAYAQKPSSYKHEQEFRYVLDCRVDTERKWEDSVTLGLGDCRDVYSLIQGPGETADLSLRGQCYDF